MAAPKEIRTKIKSIKNTQKITSAMQMVAASKMRKAQDRMLTSRPYASKIRDVVGHLAKGHPEYRHLYLEQREVKRVGLIVVTTDRGLCGGLNANLFRKTTLMMKAWQEAGTQVDLCVIGHKGLNFFKRFGGNVLAHAEHLGDAPGVQHLVGIVRVMLDAYADKKIDQVTLVYNQFVNTMSQKPIELQLLPLLGTGEKELEHYWDYIYEPDAKELLIALLTRYIEMQVYQAVIENMASEQASRMVAMKNATENAGKLIEDLQL